MPACAQTLSQTDRKKRENSTECQSAQPDATALPEAQTHVTPSAHASALLREEPPLRYAATRRNLSAGDACRRYAMPSNCA